MRVSERSLTRLRDEEHGAVLMIVAISLLVLVGMLVLTFDLGRAVAIKRQMVNGTDAAALAAAQQCALGNGTAAARAAAESVLAQNKGGAGVTTFTAPECDTLVNMSPNLVTVGSTVDVEYYFAGIFGFDSGPVVADAVAQWGPVNHAYPIPITVDNQQLINCGIPGEYDGEDLNCDLEYPKDTLQEPRWGVLDLSQWGDPDAAPCSVDAATLQEIIATGGWPDELPLNYPAATYDCVDNGLSFSVWEAMEGQVLTFPVIDIATSTGTVKPNNAPLGGTDCTGADIPDLQAQGFDCEIDTVNVISFVSLYVNSVINSGSTVIVDATFLGPTTGGGIPGTALDYGLRGVRLVK
jgi:hypothetical protein